MSTWQTMVERWARALCAADGHDPDNEAVLMTGGFFEGQPTTRAAKAWELYRNAAEQALWMRGPRTDQPAAGSHRRGYYWVRKARKDDWPTPWQIAEFNTFHGEDEGLGYWYWAASHERYLYDSDFAEIGPMIAPPLPTDTNVRPLAGPEKVE